MLIAACAALFATAGPAAAQVPAGPLSAQGVEFIRNVVTHTDSPGGRLVGKYFYLTTERDLTIYDVSTPDNPAKVGSLMLGEDAGQYYFPQEDPDTNGKVLITSNVGAIEVIDVTDKAAPKVIGRLAGTSQHTISCVLDCTWAYGSEGSIIDLRDPANPKSAGNWTADGGGADAAPYATSSNHDVTEVAPGIVLTSSEPMYLLDARTDPAHPTKLSTFANPERFIHANLWPHAMQDEIVLVGGEALGPQCADAASFMTYGAKDWQTNGFTLLDEYFLATGTPDEGRMPDSTYCVHWFTPHPGYRNGGLVAIGWYEQGTRILNVAPDGKISEVGHFLPLGGSTSAAYWITDRIIYLVDYNRGLDVVRYTGELPAPAPEPQPEPPAAPAPPADTGTNPPPAAGGVAGERADSQQAGAAPFAPSFATRFKLRGARTAVTRLVVTGLRSGSRVSVTCEAPKRRLCTRPFKTVATGSTLSLTRRFSGTLLRAGSVITVTVRDGDAAVVRRFKTRTRRLPLRVG
jgi:hypothetical protein